MARHYASTRWPTSPTALGEALGDPDRFAELFPDAGSTAWSDFAAAYAQASPQVAELTQLAQQEALRELGTQMPKGLAPAAAADRQRARLYNRRAPGSAMDAALPAHEFPLAQFVWAANRGNESESGTRMRAQLGDATYRVLNAMSERIPAEGGFLLPEILRSQLLELVLEASVVRPRAMIVPMDSLRVPFPAIDDTSHTASVYGGVTAFWTEEGASLTANGPAFARVVLEAKKLTCYTSIPNELLADAGEMLEMWIRTQWPAALAWFEDLAFINGTGVGEPQGFLNSPCAIKVTPAGGAHTVGWADIATMYGRMLPQCLRSPGLVWMCSPDVVPLLLQLTVSPGGTAVAPPVLLSGMQGIAEPPRQILGTDLIVSEKIPSSTSSNTTAAGALALVDLGMYLLGDRQSLHAAMSEEYLFGTDMIAYRMVERADGRTWMQTALEPYNGGPTLSPVVLLDTTA